MLDIFVRLLLIEIGQTCVRSLNRKHAYESSQVSAISL
jgi:hypothetical protein